MISQEHNENYGYRVTLITCVLIHFSITATNNWIHNTMSRYGVMIWNIAQGIGFLLYPILGWIADVCITRYQMMKCALIFVLVSSVVMLAGAILSLIKPEAIFDTERLVSLLFFVTSLTGSIAGMGMYEANAIQFGMDQMLEASSKELGSFIHWYYWSLNLGPLVIFYILSAVLIYIRDCTIIFDPVRKYQNNVIFDELLLLPSVFQVLLMIIGLIGTQKLQKHLNIDKTRKNSAKTIVAVLKYTWKHKYPVNRSAFTFWENDYPSRIDLDKHKYGGPFTNEQVEDVKTFLRLVVLIISLFGIHLSGDGYSIANYLMDNLGCPTFWSMLLLVMNPEHLTLLVILIGIPVYQLLVRTSYFDRYIPTLLNRIIIGLIVFLMAEACHPFLSLLLTGFIGTISECNIDALYRFTVTNDSSTATLCMLANAKVMINGTCGDVCPSVPTHDNLFLMLIFPQLLHGLAYLLVFMTVLEFICAQAPYTMKGLLIGIWYSTFSVKYLVVNITEKYTAEQTTWNIYHGVKGFSIFLSIVSFSLVCKFYRYRERDEIVNEQSIIEEQYERELLQNSDEEDDDSEENDDELLTRLFHYNR